MVSTPLSKLHLPLSDMGRRMCYERRLNANAVLSRFQHGATAVYVLRDMSRKSSISKKVVKNRLKVVMPGRETLTF